MIAKLAKKPEQLLGEFAPALWPRSRILLQTSHDDRRKFRRDPRIHFGDEHRLFVDVLVPYRIAVETVKRGKAHEALIEQHADGVEVGAAVQRLSHRLFGRHVMRSAHCAATDGEPAVELRRRDAKVGEHRVAVVVEQHVVGLHVAVHHALPVRVVERRADLRRDPHDPVHLDRAVLRQVVRETPAPEKRQNEIDYLTHLTVVDRRADERMNEPARRLRLAAKAQTHLAVARQVRVHDLHRQRPAELLVFGGVHVGHAARPEPADDAIPVAHCVPQRRDQCVGHFRRHTHVGKIRRALGTLLGGAAVPGAAIGAEHGVNLQQRPRGRAAVLAACRQYP